MYEISNAGRIIVMKQTFAEKYPHLAKEWDYERNNSMKIEDVSEKTRKIVQWRCPSGHRYEASPHDRVNGLACPYDSGKILFWKEKITDEENTQH